ncbi:MAG: hypothetical protein JW884_12815 [Deltaproteobacteria bacterium]|nr:hypothetical protein [Deltaproteobacteria bacterium]
MGNNTGWIKLHRSVMDTPEWLAEPFTRAQAWVDLLLLANHKTGFIRRRGILVTVGRGQVGYSVDSLAARWKWSKCKALRFFSDLKIGGRITRQTSANPELDRHSVDNQSRIEKTIPKKSSVTSLITIINYERYQSGDTENDTEERPKTIPEQECKEEKERNMSDPKSDSDFMRFYQAYPNRQARAKAYQAWKKLKVGNGLLQSILTAIENQKTHKAALKARGEFCPEWPMPATWLNGRRWEDEIPVVTKTDASGYFKKTWGATNA